MDCRVVNFLARTSNLNSPLVLPLALLPIGVLEVAHRSNTSRRLSHLECRTCRDVSHRILLSQARMRELNTRFPDGFLREESSHFLARKTDKVEHSLPAVFPVLVISWAAVPLALTVFPPAWTPGLIIPTTRLIDLITPFSLLPIRAPHGLSRLL